MNRRRAVIVALIAVLLVAAVATLYVTRWRPRQAVDAVTYLSNPSGPPPQPMPVDQAVAEIQALHEENGGSTVNLYFGDLGGAELYAVSLYPDRSVVVEGSDIPEDVLRSFIEANEQLLQDPRVSVGTWYNSENGLTYLDLSATLPDREEAIELGRQYNQIAIFDLSTFEEIETGGTGEAIEDLPPAGERLPEWETN